MRTYGLTGGIACGKSTVSAILRGLGAVIVDADVLAHEAVAPGQPAHDELRTQWPGCFDESGVLNRNALRQLVLRDRAALAQLNAIIQPRVAIASARELQRARGGGAQVAIYDSALLVEAGQADHYDGLIVVTVSAPVQLQRLVVRNHITTEDAQARIASQMPQPEKVRRATYVIDNNGPPAATRQRVEALYPILLTLNDAAE